MTFGVLALIVLAGLAGPLLASGRRALVPVVVGELLAGVIIGNRVRLAESG
jgi:Kef-type K+ transport system membrane component KefB